MVLDNVHILVTVVKPCVVVAIDKGITGTHRTIPEVSKNSSIENELNHHHLNGAKVV
jgi:hypothetical protein